MGGLDGAGGDIVVGREERGERVRRRAVREERCGRRDAGLDREVGPADPVRRHPEPELSGDLEEGGQPGVGVEVTDRPGDVGQFGMALPDEVFDRESEPDRLVDPHPGVSRRARVADRHHRDAPGPHRSGAATVVGPLGTMMTAPCIP
jgi:hypothetical protein